jgi:hypothetical protein
MSTTMLMLEENSDLLNITRAFCVSHCGLAISHLKKNHLKAKEEELWKLNYIFTMQKIYNLQKKTLK